MDACCCSPAVESVGRACPICGEPGTAVQLQTVKALLTEIALRQVQITHYRFCRNPSCEAVYFGDAGDCYNTSDLRVPVWHKETVGARLLCYCFGETESAIRAELVGQGHSGVVDRIREHITAQRCACDVRNPRGTCCLGDVIAAVKRMEAAMLVGKDQ
jgi:hypothetical protein